MLRIKPYLGSKSTEDYLNKKAQKGYELESITSFGLFVPLRLDAYSFKKTLKTKRVYRVDRLRKKTLKSINRFLWMMDGNILRIILQTMNIIVTIYFIQKIQLRIKSFLILNQKS